MNVLSFICFVTEANDVESLELVQSLGPTLLEHSQWQMLLEIQLQSLPVCGAVSSSGPSVITRRLPTMELHG